MVQQTVDGATTTSRKRNSYSREEKFRIIKRYGENGKNHYQTCKHFVLNSKTVIHWLADIRAPNVFVDMMPMNHALAGACALPSLLGFLPFNAALRIPVSSERELVYQH